MRTSISDFQFELKGYGRYKVTYTSPVTGKKYSNETTHMPLIDAYNRDEPKICDLNRLKKMCKS